MKATVHYGFFDESGKYKSDKIISFCGVCATESRIRQFEEEWEALLRSYEIRTLHMKHCSRLSNGCGPKMPKGQSIEERIDALLPFADCINKYMELGLLQAWPVEAYINLRWETKESLGGNLDPYYLAFVNGLLELRKHIHEDDRISIVVDQDLATAWDCFLNYRALIADNAYPEMKKVVVSLSFSDDEHFPALQASDMASYLTRRAGEQLFYGKQNEFHRLFDYLRKKKPPGSLMNWLESFPNARDFEQVDKELGEIREQQRIRKFRQDDATIGKGSPQRDKEEAGGGESGESSKKAEV